MGSTRSKKSNRSNRSNGSKNSTRRSKSQRNKENGERRERRTGSNSKERGSKTIPRTRNTEKAVMRTVRISPLENLTKNLCQYRQIVTRPLEYLGLANIAPTSTI